MNKLLLIVFPLFLLTFSADAQKIMLTDSTNAWNENGYNISGSGGTKYSSYDRYYFKGDTVVNGITYKILYLHSCKFYSWKNENTTYRRALIREDSSGVYGYFFDGNATERALYNYNWQIGDTIPSSQLKKEITGIDSVLINNVSHRVWEITHTHPNAPSFNNVISVIEGIGSTAGVLMYDPWPGMVDNKLVCFRNQNNTPALSKTIRSFDNQTSCAQVQTCPPTGINDIHAEKNNQPRVIPNPATANSYIVLPENLQSGTISIYNNQGQLIVKEQIQTARKWWLQNRITVPGIYVYHISGNQSGEVFTGKFIYE